MIKPEFFDDPELADLSLAARLFFIGLWTEADRDGRLVDNTRRLKARLFPYEDIDCEKLAVELASKDLIRRYSHSGKSYLWVRSFQKHQRPHPKEPKSVIPPCNDEPRKKTAGREKVIPDPSESGVLILDSGTQNLNDGRGRLDIVQPAIGECARTGLVVSDELGARAAALLDTFGALYAKHRHGAKLFRRRPALDWDQACQLCRTWDDARLTKMIEILLTTDDDWVSQTDRGWSVFVARAQWCDERLAVWEASHRRPT